MDRFVAFLLAASFIAPLAGCGSTEKKPSPPVANKGHDHDQEAGHHHFGPHGGLMAEVGDHEYHLEWTHNEKTGIVALIVLDNNEEGEKRKNVPIATDSLVVTADGKDYTLDAVNPEDGKSARFELKDPDLLGVIESLSDKVTAEIKEIEINGKKFTDVKLVEDHDHDH
jgi:hypothetical protein